MRKITLSLFLLVLVLGVAATAALADGTEGLGDPGIAIAPGSGVAASGVGLQFNQPGTITVDVPSGASVEQVLLYWSGEFRGASDDTIIVEGNLVTGTSIGGATVFYNWRGDVSLETFRADITDLGLVAAGLTPVSVEGLDFDLASHGAGIMVIYQEGDASSEIAVRDGQDLAYYLFEQPLDTTVPQTFSFTAADVERTADLVIFAGSVGEHNRPNAIDITVGGVTSTLVNPLFGSDGQLWDTLLVPATIPAGVSSVTVQVLSQSDGSTDTPASLNWIGATLSVPVPEEEEGGGEGCTPGYWKTKPHQDDWAATGWDQGDDFDTTFGVDFFDPDKNLLEALKARGGKENRAARHGTAALLNASHPEVSYDLSVAEVIAAVQAGHIDLLEQYNEQETPGFCD